MGNPAASNFWGEQSENFFNQIGQHLDKADYLVLDMTGFTQDQINETIAYIDDNLTLEQQARIIPIGFELE